MFALSPVTLSTHHRSSGPLWFSEAVATFGLVLVIFSLLRAGRTAAAPAAVAAYIGSAYFFTASTSFANPAVTVGRTLSNTFAGIAPASAPAFIGCQIAGGLVAAVAVRALFPTTAVTEPERTTSA
jgi:glycerol uptake facilitator-like aquaporin